MALVLLSQLVVCCPDQLYYNLYFPHSPWTWSHSKFGSGLIFILIAVCVLYFTFLHMSVIYTQHIGTYQHELITMQLTSLKHYV